METNHEEIRKELRQTLYQFLGVVENLVEEDIAHDELYKYMNSALESLEEIMLMKGEISFE